ncbi:replication restart helicase PriA [Spirochaeta lutea]|uniref:replication restart helicase PriA n=1 Tax=Spirochaeta lutea TaxID=1480694 RepID=UPI000A9671CB|nr:primosomal protein N' [Spirochaeta lutea]
MGRETGGVPGGPETPDDQEEMKGPDGSGEQARGKIEPADGGRWAGVVFNLPLDQMYTYRIPEGLPVLPGVRVRAELGRRTLMGFVLEVYTELPRELVEKDITPKDLLTQVDELPLFTPSQVELARWMSTMYYSNIGECLGAMIPGGKQERAVVLGGEEEAYQEKDVRLSEEQELGVRSICSSPRGMYYVYGMTGSGKTEVFLTAARKTVDEGRGVIYLVPEISLTRQVADSIRSRFGSSSAILHSRLTPSQRLGEWRRIVRGEARVVVGARSAVFAPVPDLGLIIVDEEHEGSYKSGSSPRYHARQIAMRRASAEGARLVMGSATPSVEAYHLMEEGKISRVSLSRRLAGGDEPEIRVVNLKGVEGCLSPDLITELKQTKDLGKQSILFLNRRGFSHFFHCRSCGYEAKCPRCSVGLTYHKSRNAMVCHYCGYRTPPMASCPECGSLDVGYAGFGTEHVEEEVRRLFPGWVIERLDTDSVKKKGSLEQIISRFRRGEIDVLLGTQMVAKGLNFPGVRLVGIVLADTGLHMPDFRSAERTFGLITQVSGRAGRYTPDGLVLVQTYNPSSSPIAQASTSRISDFYTQEIQTRRELGFPPFSRMIRLLVRSKNHHRAWSSARQIAVRLEHNRRNLQNQQPSLGETEILGPAEAPLGMVNGNFRVHILVTGAVFQAVHRMVGASIQGVVHPRGVYLEIDVDPVSLL